MKLNATKFNVYIAATRHENGALESERRKDRQVKSFWLQKMHVVLFFQTLTETDVQCIFGSTGNNPRSHYYLYIPAVTEFFIDTG